MGNKNKKFEIINGKLRYISENLDVSEEDMDDEEDLDIENDEDEDMEQNEKVASELLEHAEVSVDLVKNAINDLREGFTPSALGDFEEGVQDLNSVLEELQDQDLSPFADNLSEAVVLAVGTSKGDPDYVRKLIRGLQRMSKGELKGDPKGIKQMFERFSKMQQLDPFFDDKAHSEEMMLRNRVEDLLDDLKKADLAKVGKFIKGLANGGKENQ